MSPVSRVRRTTKVGARWASQTTSARAPGSRPGSPTVSGAGSASRSASGSAQSQKLAQQRYHRTRVLIRVGQVLMVLAGLLALEHAAAHLGAFGRSQPPTLVDLLAGWPLAVVLFIIGALLAGQRQ